MSEFVSINYTRVVCNKCGSETTIEPGRVFKELNCKCKTETAKQLKEIKEYSKEDGTVIEVVGEFSNGDLEIKYPDGSLSYRISANDFTAQFKEIEDEEVKTNTDAVTLSINDLTGKTVDEIKDEFTVDTLRVLARSQKIRGAAQMNEDKLVEKLLEKLGE